MQAALAAVPDAAVSPFDRTAALRAGHLARLRSLAVAGEAAARRAAAARRPVPLLSGELDLRTPLEGAQRLAAQLPDARLVREPGWGHDTLAPAPAGASPLPRGGSCAGSRSPAAGG